MDESTATILAALFEFGLFAVFICLAVYVKPYRHIVMPTLGAITPFCAFMLFALFAIFLQIAPEQNMYLAGFVMGFIPYMMCMVFGVLLGFLLPKKVGLAWRYFIGLVVGPGTSAVLLMFL